MALIPIDNPKRVAAQAGSAVAFAAGYAAVEALVLEDYLYALGLTEPALGDLYPYHLMIMLPVFAGVALLVGHDPRILRNALDAGAWGRTIINGVQVFFPLVIMEDALYFAIHGRTIQPDDWTCLHGGCIDAGFTHVPHWYIAGSAIAGAAWLMDNFVFRRR